MLYFARGADDDALELADLQAALRGALDRLGPRRRVLVVPPDFTRFHSQAGVLTRLIYEYYGARLTAVLPALGTHSPMMPAQIAEMYAGVPPALFRVHNWRRGVTTIGEVPAGFVRDACEARVVRIWASRKLFTCKALAGQIPAHIPHPWHLISL